MTVVLARVGWTDPRAEELRDGMELEMNELYGSSMDGLDPVVVKALLAGFSVDPSTIVATVLALDDSDGEQRAVGQAGLRPHVGTRGQPALEVKKVIVDPAYRGRGISKALMLELEVAARELGIAELILQTGDLQLAAIGLYVSIGYELIERTRHTTGCRRHSATRRQSSSSRRDVRGSSYANLPLPRVE